MVTSLDTDLDTATGQRWVGEFETLGAQFSLFGMVLIRTDPAVGGQAPYYAMRWSGGLQALDDLEAARVYFATLVGVGDGGE